LTGPERPGALSERLRAGEKVAALSEQIFSLAGDSDSATDAIEEPNTEVLLELADLSPEGGLTHPKPCGRLGEAPRLRHGNEVTQVPEIHNNAFQALMLVDIMQWTQDGTSHSVDESSGETQSA
jgi:hypothetical protein